MSQVKKQVDNLAKVACCSKIEAIRCLILMKKRYKFTPSFIIVNLISDCLLNSFVSLDQIYLIFKESKNNIFPFYVTVDYIKKLSNCGIHGAKAGEMLRNYYKVLYIIKTGEKN